MTPKGTETALDPWGLLGKLDSHIPSLAFGLNQSWEPSVLSKTLGK